MSRFPSSRLDGKVVVVTGASSGIGFAVAEACAEAGARLVLPPGEGGGSDLIVAAAPGIAAEFAAALQRVGAR